MIDRTFREPAATHWLRHAHSQIQPIQVCQAFLTVTNHCLTAEGQSTIQNSQDPTYYSPLIVKAGQTRVHKHAQKLPNCVPICLS